MPIYEVFYLVLLFVWFGKMNKLIRIEPNVQAWVGNNYEYSQALSNNGHLRAGEDISSAITQLKFLAKQMRQGGQLQ